jgi:flagellar hook protein FlgE
MALTSTLFTGLTGMTVNQRRLNVIGNNIANVNTTAFKSSRVLFRPQFYITDSNGAPPSADFGGTNPNQRGLGATVGSIQKSFTPGTIETTGVNTDLAIDGDGFFIVGNGDKKFTRDGSFILNDEQELVTSRGEYVQGYGVDQNFNVVKNSLGNLKIPIGGLTTAEATSKIAVKGNLNSSGSVATSAGRLLSEPLLTSTSTTPDATTPLVDLRRASATGTAAFNDGDTITLDGKRGGESVRTGAEGPLQFKITAATTLGDLQEFFTQAFMIDTSADTVAAAPAGFTPGTTIVPGSGTDPAGSVRLQIMGNPGAVNELGIDSNSFKNGAVVPFNLARPDDDPPTGEGSVMRVQAYDSLGSTVNIALYTAMESKSDQGITYRYWAVSNDDTDVQPSFTPGASTNGGVLGTGTITFDNQGKLTASTGNQISVDRTNTGAVTPLNIDLNFNEMTSLEKTGSSMAVASKDGMPTGNLDLFGIGEDGRIVGTFTNGLQRTLGQVAIATFDNQQGLVDLGSNNYTVSASSGEPVIGAPGEFNAGMIKGGSLEQSNVDLSKEFIDMIITSTGFSAASRVISTADRLMTELLQTSR